MFKTWWRWRCWRGWPTTKPAPSAVRPGGLVGHVLAVKREDFNSALAYLVRRLDEHTAAQFLRDTFGITPQPRPGHGVIRLRARVEGTPRFPASHVGHASAAPEQGFHNAGDTDWTQCNDRDALTKASRALDAAGADDLHRVLETARPAQPAWELLGIGRRADVLKRCGALMSGNASALSHAWSTTRRRR